MWLHSRRMEETLWANDPRLQDYLAGMSHALGSAEAAVQSLAGTIQQLLVDGDASRGGASAAPHPATQAAGLLGIFIFA